MPIAKSDSLCELSFSADGSWLAGRTESGKIYVWTTKGHVIPGALDSSQGPKEALRLEQPSDQLWQQFDAFTKDGSWREAAKLGVQLIEQKPDVDSIHWLAVPPVLVLAGDETGYAVFCNKMLQRFAESEKAEDAERTVKACLLRPNVIALSKLPHDKLTKTLDDGTAQEWFSVFGWSTRALLACRSGDAESAVKYANRFKEPEPPEFAQALHLVVLALSQHQLHRHDEARKALNKSLQLITRLEQDADTRGHKDLLIATILLREAEVKINGKPETKSVIEVPAITGEKTSSP